MTACMGDPEIEGTPAVSECSPTAPPIAGSSRIRMPTLPGNEHQAEIGNRVGFILLSGTQEKKPCSTLIPWTTKPMEAHETHIKHACREPSACGLIVIGTRSDQILPHTSPGMQHRPVIVGSSNMTGVSGTPHEFSTTKECVAAPA